MATYTNTRDILGDQGALDALVEHSLTEFTDDGVKTLRRYAFRNQEQLEELCLPNLTRINTDALNGCYRLRKIKVGLNIASVIGLTSATVFDECSRAIIYVPDDLVASYKSASNWKTSGLVERIYGISDENGPQEWSETEISDTWEQIAAKISAGTAANSYKYGQYKTIDLGSEGTIRFQIVAKNADELADGTGTAQLTWLAIEGLATQRRWNPAYVSGTVATGGLGGWKESEIRSICETTFLPLFPQSVRNLMKSVKKYSNSFDAAGLRVADEMTNDTLWIPSFGELHGNIESMGPAYLFAFKNQKAKAKNKYGGAEYHYWLRSAAVRNQIYYISIGGSNSMASAQNTYAVVLGFCT